MMDYQKLIEENRRRRAAIVADVPPEMEPVRRPEDVRRFAEDFEFWAERCVKIRHKLSGRRIPFRLNRAQKHLLTVLEGMRRGRRPIRIILLKSRQWGGSTLIQIYMAWIQMVHRENWHSLICAHVKDTAATIRGMYSQMLENYPEIYVDPEGTVPEFKGFERSQNTRVLTGRNCRVTIGSAETQDSARGNDFSMAHLSEVAFWRSGPAHSPLDMMRSVTSGIPMEPYTLIALESTANGVGNFFHSEWIRAEKGKSAFQPVFVPWYMAEFNELRVEDVEGLWESLDEYERGLWRDHPVTLEQLNWYHHKRLEAPSHEVMKAEYPTTALEAFTNSGSNLFAPGDINRLRPDVAEPAMTGSIEGRALTGRAAIDGVKFHRGESGLGGVVNVWRDREEGRRYVVAVDIGGRSDSSDFSVVAVLTRRVGERRPEVVAQWRGHIDHDLLAWKAAAIATYYNKALLVIESNTLETDVGSSIELDGAYLLQQLNHVYSNLYRRRVEDAVSATPVMRVGFHTNRRTKQMIISHLISMVRDAAYIERDATALNELATYERLPNGSLAAHQGCHDDVLMTRAIALFVIDSEPMSSSPDVLAQLRRGHAT